MSISASSSAAATAAAKLCLCQLCTCPERLHRCVYAEGEEDLRRASVEHCRRCGCSAKRGKPYIPMGPMETTTTYNAEYQVKAADAGRVKHRPAAYVRPGAPMQDATTYNADFTSKRQDRPALASVRPGQYRRPMGDMMLETTYNGDFQRKSSSDSKVSFKPPSYQRPMGPMILDTTYGSDFTEKRPTGGSYMVCCPCCDPRSHGYLQQGEENGHTMFTQIRA